MRHLRMPIAAFVIAGVATGCSSVPDAINPLEWFDNTVELFSDKGTKVYQEAPKATIKNEVDAVSDKQTTFPKLSNVDGQRKSADIRVKGLVADVRGRKYAPTIARQGEATNVLSVAPSRPSVITAAAASTALTKTPKSVAQPNVTDAPPQLGATLPNSVPGQDDFQTRFIKRLSEIRSKAAKNSLLMRYSVTTSNQIPIETVVVSSSGTETNYGELETKYVGSADMGNNKLTYLAEPFQPLSDNVLRVATIRFKNGSAKLSSRDRRILAKVVRLKNERGGRIRIVGHASSRTQNTDPISHKMINFRVSAARADVVARELQRLGTDRSQLQVDAVSDSAPEFLEVMPTGEAGNRRAEIYLDS